VGEQNISQEGLSVGSYGRNEVPGTVSCESRVVSLVETIGKGLEMERRVGFGENLDVTETSEAAVDGVGGEEGDVDILKNQKLRELQHGHNMRG